MGLNMFGKSGDTQLLRSRSGALITQYLTRSPKVSKFGLRKAELSAVDKLTTGKQLLAVSDPANQPLGWHLAANQPGGLQI